MTLVPLVASCGSGTGEGGSDRSVLLTEVRAAEDLVVGRVFTMVMSNDEVVRMTQALCQIEVAHGLEGAIGEASQVLKPLDWDAAANPAMVALMLRVGATTVCTETDPSNPTSLDGLASANPPIGSGSTGAEVERSIAAFLETIGGIEFIGAIRALEVAHDGVFSGSMSDEELVRLGIGICSTWAELGPAADAELAGTQEIYGWTSDADDLMWNHILDTATAVCITVGD